MGAARAMVDVDLVRGTARSVFRSVRKILNAYSRFASTVSCGLLAGFVSAWRFGFWFSFYAMGVFRAPGRRPGVLCRRGVAGAVASVS